ncbi:MAG: hypothetical protein AAFU85_29290, partial [Planctomycetota bacterium]
DIKHAFTVTAPAYLKWFGENLTNLLSDAFNGATTIAFNAGQKIGRVTRVIANGVKTAFTGDFVGDLKEAMSGDLLEGFKAQTSAMPEIAKRALTETEKVLQERTGKFAADFTGEWMKRVGERNNDLAAQVDNIAAATPTVDLKLNSSGALDSLAGLWESVSGQATQFLGDFWEGVTSNAETPEAGQQQTLQAQESRLLAGRSNRNDQLNVMREAVKETQRSNSLLQQIVDGVTGGGLQVEYV